MSTTILTISWAVMVVLYFSMVYLNYRLRCVLRMATDALKRAGEEIQALNAENELYLAKIKSLAG